MNVVFSSYAAQELDDAVNYLELEFEGLGGRFESEVKRALHLIARHPQAWVVERGEIRKCVLHKFPYKVLYSIESNYIFIIAIAHQHREPDYWINRPRS